MAIITYRPLYCVFALKFFYMWHTQSQIPSSATGCAAAQPPTLKEKWLGFVLFCLTRPDARGPKESPRHTHTLLGRGSQAARQETLACRLASHRQENKREMGNASGRADDAADADMDEGFRAGNHVRGGGSPPGSPPRPHSPRMFVPQVCI